VPTGPVTLDRIPGTELPIDQSLGAERGEFFARHQGEGWGILRERPASLQEEVRESRHHVRPSSSPALRETERAAQAQAERGEAEESGAPPAGELAHLELTNGLTWLDWVILVLVLLFAVRGLFRGTLGQIFGLVGLVAALWTASWLARWVAGHWEGARPAGVFWALGWLVALLAGVAGRARARGGGFHSRALARPHGRFPRRGDDRAPGGGAGHDTRGAPGVASPLAGPGRDVGRLAGSSRDADARGSGSSLPDRARLLPRQRVARAPARSGPAPRRAPGTAVRIPPSSMMLPAGG